MKPIINESKSFQTFRSEIQSLKQHLQVIDAVLTSSGKQLDAKKSKKETIADALGTSELKHDTLNHPVSSYVRIFNYTRSKNAEFSIIDIYNSFSVYMKNILTEMFKHNPLQVVGKATGIPNFSYIELINFGDYKKIEFEMIEKVFRRLEEERSTTKLLDKILSHTNIELNKELKTNALMYLEMRHLFIHNNGKADNSFVSLYGSKLSFPKDNKLPTNFDTVSNAINSIYDLVEEIDKKLIVGGYIENR